MINLSTNLSSLLAQSSLKTSSLKLNQAVERMTTGCKINHAKDNAANYSIATSLSTKIRAYQVAEDNLLTGLDMVQTASSSLSIMSDLASRLRSLAMQAQNGTYGNSSLDAINSEAFAIVNELFRIRNNTEYNGINLLSPSISAGADMSSINLPKLKSNNFLDEVQKIDTSNAKKLSECDEYTTILSGMYTISTAEELAKLATMVNNGMIGDGTFVLTDDIDLSMYSQGEGWEPIGNSEYNFRGSFYGNGHTISNLYINRPNEDAQGLFSILDYSSTWVYRDFKIVNANVTAKDYTGILAGKVLGSVQNCSVEGDVSGNYCVGGIAGNLYGRAYNCYSKVVVIGTKNVGGIAGNCVWGIHGCYSDSNVTGESYVGGVVGNTGSAKGVFEDNFSSGKVNGVSYVGGLCGSSGQDAIFENNLSYADAYGENYVGGFAGYAYSAQLTNNIAMGNVSGKSSVGGFIGNISWSGTFSNNTSYGNVVGDNFVGGLVGSVQNNNSQILESLTLSSVSGNSNVGAIAGKAFTISDCYYKAENLDACSWSSAILNNVNNISDITKRTLQVGIDSKSSSTLNIDMSFLEFDSLLALSLQGVDRDSALENIDIMLEFIANKQTDFGAIENRLTSALESISIQYENLVSSRSTIQDADIAEVSSEYIRQQILQQASATLMATANQTPAIALQLL